MWNFLDTLYIFQLHVPLDASSLNLRIPGQFVVPLLSSYWFWRNLSYVFVMIIILKLWFCTNHTDTVSFLTQHLLLISNHWVIFSDFSMIETIGVFYNFTYFSELYFILVSIYSLTQRTYSVCFSSIKFHWLQRNHSQKDQCMTCPGEHILIT